MSIEKAAIWLWLPRQLLCDSPLRLEMTWCQFITMRKHRDKQNIHTSMTKKIHVADSICNTRDVIDSSHVVKIHREKESDVEHECELNICRYGTWADCCGGNGSSLGILAADFLNTKWVSAGRDNTWLCGVIWYYSMCFLVLWTKYKRSSQRTQNNTFLRMTF